MKRQSPKPRDMMALALVGQVRALHVELDKFNAEFGDATQIAPESFKFFTEKLVEVNNALLTRWTDE